VRGFFVSGGCTAPFGYGAAQGGVVLFLETVPGLHVIAPKRRDSNDIKDN
jgi:hypothetical protein